MYILTDEARFGKTDPAGQQSPGSTRPPLPAPAVPKPVPKLIQMETAPALTTLYVGIDLNPVWESRKIDGQWKSVRSYAAPMTGIFIPKSYVPQSTVNLILYLHGFKTPCGLGERATIDQYWSQGFFQRLREAVNDSGKNVILVAPTLGPRSGAGRLIKAGGFNAFLDQVLAALNAYNPLNQIPLMQQFTQVKSVGQIILACHSGGGKPMRSIAHLNPKTDSYVTQIRECWGFDCLYNGDDAAVWKQWAKSHPSANLIIYYQKSTAEQSKQLCCTGLNNILVQPSDAKNHCSVPGHHWKERLQNLP